MFIKQPLLFLNDRLVPVSETEQKVAHLGRFEAFCLTNGSVQ